MSAGKKQAVVYPKFRVWVYALDYPVYFCQIKHEFKTG
jgi:hypothetical protein